MPGLRQQPRAARRQRLGGAVRPPAHGRPGARARRCGGRSAAPRSTRLGGHLGHLLGVRRASSLRTTWRASITAACGHGLAICCSSASSCASKPCSSGPICAVIWRGEALLEAVQRHQPVAVAVLVAGLARGARPAACSSARPPAARRGRGRGAGRRVRRVELAVQRVRAPGGKAAQLLARDEARVGRGRARRAGPAAPCGGGTLRKLLDEFVVAAAADHDLAFVGQAAHDLEHFLLLGLDLGHAHRAARFQVFAQRLGGAAWTCS